MSHFEIDAPPLEYAACYAEFQGGKERNSDFPHRVYHRMITLFPHKEKREKDKDEVSDQNPLHCRNLDGSVSTKLGLNRVSVNQVSVNMRWDEFRHHIEKVMEHYWAEGGPDSLKALLLVYGNEIPMPVEPMHFDDFLNIHPTLPKGRRDLPWAIWDQSVTLVLKELNGIFKVSANGKSAVKDLEGSSVEFELQMMRMEPENLSREDIMSWLDQAHAEIEKTFVDSLTDASKKAIGYREA